MSSSNQKTKVSQSQAAWAVAIAMTVQSDTDGKAAVANLKTNLTKLNSNAQSRYVDACRQAGVVPGNTQVVIPNSLAGVKNVLREAYNLTGATSAERIAGSIRFRSCAFLSLNLARLGEFDA